MHVTIVIVNRIINISNLYRIAIYHPAVQYCHKKSYLFRYSAIPLFCYSIIPYSKLPSCINAGAIGTSAHSAQILDTEWS